MTSLLEGTVAVVSGVGRGLGRHTCLTLVAHGATVVAGDVDAGCLEELEADGAGKVTGVVTDITDRAQCDRLCAAAVERHGRIDVLVNDAYHPGDFTEFADADLAVWRQAAEVTYLGTLQMTQAALAHMDPAGQGRIVMVVTQGVEWIQKSFGSYTAPKASIAHMVRLLAAELGPKGIRVNGVFPGPIWGPALQGYLGSMADERGVPIETVYGEWAAEVPLAHLVTPEDIAGAIVFFASELSTWVTGQALYVNAGQWFH